jgi:catechol 2,3-dioxygenase-like lactoylglutathione lyase family enzyme
MRDKELTLTTSSRSICLIIALLAAIAVTSANPQASESNSQSVNSPTPKLVNTCLISANLDRLVDFYESVLMLKAQRSGKDYAEFQTGVGVLAIFSASAQEKYIPGSAKAGRNQSAILEFSVTNVDKEYARLQGLVKTWVKPPTTQPWGTRSIYFRDPDGNLVDFYTPAAPR